MPNPVYHGVLGLSLFTVGISSCQQGIGALSNLGKIIIETFYLQGVTACLSRRASFVFIMENLLDGLPE